MDGSQNSELTRKNSSLWYALPIRTLLFQKTSCVAHWNSPTAAKTTASPARSAYTRRTVDRVHSRRASASASSPNGSTKKTIVIEPSRTSSLQASERPNQNPISASGSASGPSSRSRTSPSQSCQPSRTTAPATIPYSGISRFGAVEPTCTGTRAGTAASAPSASSHGQRARNHATPQAAASPKMAAAPSSGRCPVGASSGTNARPPIAHAARPASRRSRRPETSRSASPAAATGPATRASSTLLTAPPPARARGAAATSASGYRRGRRRGGGGGGGPRQADGRRRFRPT